MIYLDNAATTRMTDFAAEALKDASLRCYANSESLHSLGFSAMTELEHSREIIASKMGVSPSELYFCACGTLADNTAVFGSLFGKRGGRVVTSAFEHPAVSECFKALEKDYEVVYLKPENGIITPSSVAEAMTEDTRLVSIMQVNNETGAVADIKKISETVHRVKGAVFHTDAVQGFMKEASLYSYADTASFSAHKTHGPKGIGALYVRKGIKIKPVYYGGGHEKGIFSGTANVPGAVAWAKALSEADVKRDRKYVEGLNSLAKELLKQAGAIIISPENASPYIISAVFPGYISENIVHALSSKDIHVSTGSACSSKHPGAVFKALGLERYAKNALRISFSYMNTEEDIKIFASELGKILPSLIRK